MRIVKIEDQKSENGRHNGSRRVTTQKKKKVLKRLLYVNEECPCEDLSVSLYWRDEIQSMVE